MNICLRKIFNASPFENLTFLGLQISETFVNESFSCENSQSTEKFLGP